MTESESDIKKNVSEESNRQIDEKNSIPKIVVDQETS